MFRLQGVACEHSRVLLIVLLWRISFARRSSHASRGEALLIVLLLSVSFARRGVKDYYSRLACVSTVIAKDNFFSFDIYSIL